MADERNFSPKTTFTTTASMDVNFTTSNSASQSVDFSPTNPTSNVDFNTDKHSTDIRFTSPSRIVATFGNITYDGSAKIYYGTTAYWNSRPYLKSIEGAIYIYSDYSHDEQGRDIPGLKVGDGNAYLIDIPFIGSSAYMDNIICDTVEGWASKPSYQTAEGFLYVYTDYKLHDGKYIPGLKVGTGNAYLIDTPFVDQVYAEHVENTDIHITAEEREFWNNKVTCYIDPLEENRLVFSKN